MGRIAVTIMAKAPRAGEVKTRLSPPLSATGAAELYRCFLLDKIEQVRSLTRAIPAIAYTPPDGRDFFEGMAPDFLLLPQRGPDLGARLANSLEHLFALGHMAAFAIDSDSPTLPTAHLEQALDLIATPGIDLVLGPSEDGGYYLIGLRALHPELFEDMPWSTAQVVPETFRRAEGKGLTVATLPPWFDIDTSEDLKRLEVSLGGPAGNPARHTRRFFMERTT
ncbi:MAG: TIGR04282 family arsenosugar biosynthesis glycosyltransferase [candidate division NC10 bacterium]|nr:TIGR04282 family arsenosugar biosynthesis glycosyltransferase [candidate division NC10 bacterium]